MHTPPPGSPHLSTSYSSTVTLNSCQLHLESHYLFCLAVLTMICRLSVFSIVAKHEVSLPTLLTCAPSGFGKLVLAVKVPAACYARCTHSRAVPSPCAKSWASHGRKKTAKVNWGNGSSGKLQGYQQSAGQPKGQR